MSGSGIKSLFNSVNFFQRKPQTWAVPDPADAVGVSQSGCQFEELESRTLMSVSHPHGHTHHVHQDPTPSVSAKPKAAPLVAPAAPTSLTATPLTFNSVQLNWTAGTGTTTGFLVLRGTDGVHFSQVAKITNGNILAYTDKSVASFHNYNYEVEAINGTAVSPASAPAAASTSLATPATFSATATGPASVQLNWAINEPLATGYLVLRSTDGIHFSQLAQIPGIKTGSYADTTVSSNKSYSYEIQAYNGNKTSAASKAITITTPLTAPTALTATLQNSAINLSWTGNDASATGYIVLRSVNGAAFAQVANVTGSATTSYSDTAIISGRTYAYKVQAYAGNNTSALITATAVSTPLTAPSALSATAASPTVVHLAWTNNDANPTGYNILRSTDGVHFTRITQVIGATVAAYNDGTAVSGTTYYYQVSAFAGTITSNAVTSASVMTPLATPATLTVTVLSPTSVKLTWTVSDQQAGGYNVLRSTNGGNYVQVAQLTGKASNTFTDTVSSDTAYSYQVQAISNGNSSAVSKAVAITTPLIPVSGLTASLSGTSVQLNWTDNDSSATGYKVLRASDGVHFTQIANITGGAVNSYTDTSSLSGHAYNYEVQAVGAGNMASAFVATSALTIPLSAPISLAATTPSPTSIALTWTNTDTNATSYFVLRSLDGTHFTQIAKLTNANASSYTDTTAASGQNYTYEVQAANGTITSPVSNTANVTAPLAAPATLAATMAGAYVNLTWIDKAALATGYNILRSTDGTNFTQLVQLTSATANSYSDTTVTAGQTYYYQVQAYNTLTASVVSNTATINTPSGNVTGGVSVVTRFGDELVIVASGSSDSISITESGGILTITGDGEVFTDAAPAGGTFIYTRGGSDSVNVDASVNSQLTIESVDGTPTVITSTSSSVQAWIDSTDTLIGTAISHAIATFAGGVSKALGASMANPKDAGTTTKQNLSLFGSGPVASDVNQGSVGDCYFLSSLAAFAGENPTVLMNSAVDVGDGTYIVEFHRSGSPVYVRVNNSFTAGGFGGYAYAHPGSNNTLWAVVMEKAFAYFRTGANTYASINSGWMGEVYSDLGIASNNFTPSSLSDSALFNALSNDLSNGEAITFGTQNAPNLVSGHAYTLIGVTNTGGVNHYIVRNPWGVSGDSLENSQGIASLTYAQLIANFVAGCVALN